MKAFVFTDKSLERHAGRFVWLAVDIEKPANAPFLAKFPIQGVPTLIVMDAPSEKVALRTFGAATVPQMDRFLEEGARAVKGRASGVEELIRNADRLYGAGKDAEAVKAFKETLTRAPKGWPRYGRAMESYLVALQNTKAYEVCATEARDSLPRLATSPSAANVVATGLDCAMSMPAGTANRESLLETMRVASKGVIAEARRDRQSSRKPRIAGDDISAIYGVLVQDREEAKDEPGKLEIAEQWAGFLENEASRAENAEQRAVFDSHRLGAYLKLDQPERAIPMLEASERDLPGDYNPPARLSAAYKAMKKYDQALAASDRALAKAYGPRRIGMLRSRADIYAAKGDSENVRKTLKEAIDAAEALPQGQRSEGTIAALKKRLDGMPAN